MTNIVERLEATGGKGQGGPLKKEAADEIRKLRAIIASAQGAGWRLVDTAPHETYVLLGWMDDGIWNCQTGMASHGWRRVAYSTMSLHGQATHWMPLPAGPTLSSAERAGNQP